jgi:hypothetical protein
MPNGYHPQPTGEEFAKMSDDEFTAWMRSPHGGNRPDYKAPKDYTWQERADRHSYQNPDGVEFFDGKDFE